MPVKRPQPGDLEAIETASRDEISALQLERLKWSVRHTYDNVEPYRKRCQEKGVHPDDLKQHRLIASADQVHWDFPGYQLKARARLGCATVQGAINAAVQGAGLIRCLSYPVHEHLLSRQLHRVLPDFELPPLPVQVVYREGRNAPMRVRSFVDHCVMALREHPAFQLA